MNLPTLASLWLLALVQGILSQDIVCDSSSSCSKGTTLCRSFPCTDDEQIDSIVKRSVGSQSSPYYYNRHQRQRPRPSSGSRALRASEMLGKRTSDILERISPQISGKRSPEFLGKRSLSSTQWLQKSELLGNEIPPEYDGKRSIEFLGKRSLPSNLLEKLSQLGEGEAVKSDLIYMDRCSDKNDLTKELYIPDDLNLLLCRWRKSVEMNRRAYVGSELLGKRTESTAEDSQ